MLTIRNVVNDCVHAIDNQIRLAGCKDYRTSYLRTYEDGPSNSVDVTIRYVIDGTRGQYVLNISNDSSDHYIINNDINAIVDDILQHRNKSNVSASTTVYADTEYTDLSDVQDLVDQVEDAVDTLDDLNDLVNDIDEDEPNIEITNNITNHYIAECDSCHGIFISAIKESDQHIEYIEGTCPLCGKETSQNLNWIIRDVD